MYGLKFGSYNIASGVFDLTYQDKQQLSLTLLTDGHGTLTADTITGYAGDTVTLSPTYNTYYRFSGYEVTGGTISDNTFTFGDSDATVQANFSANKFVASGTFEKGSNVVASSYRNVADCTSAVAEKYAIVSYHSDNVPSAWYSTSSRWKVTTSPSAYSMSMNAKMTFTLYDQTSKGSNYPYAAATAVSLVGSTQQQSQSFTQTASGTSTKTYSKTITTTTTGVNYGVSAKLYAIGYTTSINWIARATYVAAGTSGTWTATGYAP